MSTVQHNRFRAGVIGLGAIGYGYDLSNSQCIQTHARAFRAHAVFQLVAGVDPNITSRTKFSEAYDVPAYSNIDDLASHINELGTMDVYAISVPTEYHYDVINQLLHSDACQRPKAILCEKPLADNVVDAEKIVDLCENLNISLMINFWRRFEPGVNELKRGIRENSLGQFEYASVFFKRGIANNAAHFIDLLFYLFDAPQQELIFHSVDSSVQNKQFSLSLNGRNIDFIAMDSVEYNFFEMKLVFEKGVVDYRDAGKVISIRTLKNDDAFLGYAGLENSRDIECTDFDRYQWYVMDHLSGVIAGQRENISTGQNALKSARIVAEVESRLM